MGSGIKDRKYVLVHAVKCIIATPAKSVFKILDFTSAISRQILKVAHHLYKHKFYLYKDALCAKAKNSVQPIQRKRCLKFQLGKNHNFDN